MKEIVVLSGKGGTGKTTVTAAFAALASRPVIADCDVDAADLHLVLAPEARESHDFYGGKKAAIRPELCAACGTCKDNCRFDAIRPPDGDGGAYLVEPAFCEGCGVCVHFCPNEAILFEDSLSGKWFCSKTRFGPLVHARLAPTEENSGKLVTIVRQRARREAERKGASVILVDGPPGTGCPAIASLTGADFAVIVTEPTGAGWHDMRRVRGLARHFQIPAGLIINKWDLNPRLTAELESSDPAEDLPLIGKLSYHPDADRAQRQAVTVMELRGSGLARELRNIWSNLGMLIHQRRPVFEIVHSNS